MPSFPKLPHPLSSWLKECLDRVQTRAVANELWNAELTRDQQIDLGDDFEKAWRKNQSAIGMWMKLRSIKSPLIAAVEVARAVKLIQDSRAGKLLEALGGNPTLPNADRPVWNRVNGTLVFRGITVRKVKTFRKPSNIEKILDAFQTLGWPERIEVPDDFDVDMVRETVRSLNESLTAIRFERQNGSRFIRWRKA